MSNDNGKVYGMGIFLFLGALCGIGGSGKEQLPPSGVTPPPGPPQPKPVVPEPSRVISLVMAPPAGSVFLGGIGLLGVLYLAFCLRGLRAWKVLILGYFVDQILTIVFALPILEIAMRDPFGIGPSILGVLGTFFAGVFVGFLVPHIPLRVAFGLVSLDALLVGLSGIFGLTSPQQLSMWLVFRILAAYSAAGFGAIIGQYALISVIRKGFSVGKFLARSAFACGTAVASGVLTALILRYVIQ